MYKIIVGTVSLQRQKDWFSKDENPYAVWEGKALLEKICTIDAWITADRILRDHVDVDWGSIAWKANKQELTRLFKLCNWDASELKHIKENTNYAVVFIETVWGDSA